MYNYAETREKIFSDKGQIMFLAIRDKANALLAKSGAVRMQELISGISGDSWMMLACVDRLVELGELCEIPQSSCAGQFRIFVRA